MRIPVTLADLNQGRFTKIARALKKSFPNEKWGLMRSQNELASLLGYRDLHDLQSNTSQTESPKHQWSRTAINNAVGWKLFRNHGADLSTASALAEKLHLQMLDVDAATSEAAFERTQKEYEARGQFLMRDEFWDYANPTWNEKTPDLLDASIPGYSYAVLNNKTVFRWALLEGLLDRLPKDFADDLKADARYQHFGDSKTLEMAFIKQELYPQACASLLNTAKAAQILPAGFEIMWIFADGGDFIGQCLGRVLNNKAIGGIIPIVYPADTDDIFTAIGELMCGQVLAAQVDTPSSDDEFVFVRRSAYGHGYDLAKDTRATLFGDEKVTARDMERLPDHIRYSIADGHPVLLGNTFVENDQIYLRNQNWMVSQDVPRSIDTVPRTEHNHSSYMRSGDAIPASALSLFNSADASRERLFEDAKSKLTSAKGIDQLTSLVFDIVSCADFDTYCDNLIYEDLPLRNEDDTEDQQELVEEREDEIDRLMASGQKIKSACPSLAAFDDSTLGYILLLAHNEGPGSRHSGFIYPPEADDLDGISKLLLGMVFHAVCCISNRKPKSFWLNVDVLTYVVNRTLDGANSCAQVIDDYEEIDAFCKRMVEQGKFIHGVVKWRDAEAAMQNVRDRGEFLYVGTPVGREKPKGLADLYAMTRSAGFAPMLVKQKLSDFASASP